MVLSFPVGVLDFVKVGEQEQEHEAMQGDPDHERFRIVAFGYQKLQLVGENGDELQHLEGRQVPFPPDVLLVLGTHRGHHVVEVHDYVHEGIEQREERTMTTCKRSLLLKTPVFFLNIFTWSELHPHPHRERHASVVNDVQRRHVTRFLAQNEKERVEKLGELREIIPPARSGHL